MPDNLPLVLRQWNPQKGAKSNITFSGPFFRFEPGDVVRSNIRQMLNQMADEGEREVQAAIATAPLRHPTGWTRSHVMGRTKALAGKPWAVTAVVGMNPMGLDAKKAIRTQAAGATVERLYHPFRRVTAALKRFMRADLTKGMQ
jgi:hypothetical protein